MIVCRNIRASLSGKFIMGTCGRAVVFLVAAFALSPLPAVAGTDSYASLDGDTLVIGNSLIERKFVWNGGNLMTASLTDKALGTSHEMTRLTPDFFFAGDSGPGEDASFSVTDVPQTEIRPAHKVASVTYSKGSLLVRREYRIYDGCPAIACDTWLRWKDSGAAAASDSFQSTAQEVNAADRKNIEFAEDMKSASSNAVLDRLSLGGMHWHAKAVEFWDVTDWNNNLVTERDIISYRKTGLRGNLLFLRNGEDGNGLWFLKEAPCSSVQLAYRGSDFIADFGSFAVTGLGIGPEDIDAQEWTKAYSCVVGVYGPGELSALTSLRSYQKNIRRHIGTRDEMVMMNTWGDRSQDTKVNEAFCLAELEKAARLGITHFQIDDGWQVGKSPNSALAKGSFKNIWDNPDYWTPDPVKYPHGLTPIVEKGRELGIEICLWFNPSVQNDFADWEKDAAAITALYKEYGIRTFKIDGLAIPSKTAETNLRRLFDKVLADTDNQVMFNLDATAGRRGGYHMFNEYGNIFLENRYTDWQNYYPYWTLRNLWQLSKYVPAEKMQIEFLNKWRNAGKYGDDPFAPARYDFGYLFAISMAGQPLAWMEASNLPEEAFSLGSLVSEYRKVQEDFHNGVILPIGEEPSGRSWTGFQSISDDRSGYVLVFRESSGDSCAPVSTWLPEGTKLSLTSVLGDGKPFKAVAGRDGTVEFSLPRENSFALYRYELK